MGARAQCTRRKVHGALKMRTIQFIGDSTIYPFPEIHHWAFTGILKLLSNSFGSDFLGPVVYRHITAKNAGRLTFREIAKNVEKEMEANGYHNYSPL